MKLLWMIALVGWLGTMWNEHRIVELEKQVRALEIKIEPTTKEK